MNDWKKKLRYQLKGITLMFFSYMIIILLVVGILFLSYPVLNPHNLVIIKGLIIINLPIIIYLTGVLLGIHRLKELPCFEKGMISEMALHSALLILIVQLSIMVINR